jgi:hypothetical protein
MVDEIVDETEKELAIRTTIEDDLVVAVSIDGLDFPLREPLPMQRLVELTKAIKNANKYFPIIELAGHGLNKLPWTSIYLKDFLKELKAGSDTNILYNMLVFIARKGSVSKVELLSWVQRELNIQDTEELTRKQKNLVMALTFKARERRSESPLISKRTKTKVKGSKAKLSYHIRTPKYRQIILKFTKEE